MKINGKKLKQKRIPNIWAEKKQLKVKQNWQKIPVAPCEER